MGDSETVVAQTPAVEEYASTGYSASVFVDASMNTALDSGASAAGDSGDLAAAATTTDNGDLGASAGIMDAYSAVPHDYDIGATNADTTDVNCVKQEASSTTMHDISENLASFANTSMDSSQVAAYESSVNGNDVNEARNMAVAGMSENGISSYDVHGSTSVQQLEDGSALSVEEDRLWSIVRANSLDFNSWTALIEEMEKMPEGNILKIRKVYDAFLAEFPLCYGYWKKYADHEGRLDSIDKVVEVYERAVLGVTYSVDMWLHYCVFVINTYGNSDIIRR